MKTQFAQDPAIAAAISRFTKTEIKKMQRYSLAKALAKEWGARPATASRWLKDGKMPVIYAVRKLRKDKAK